MLSAARRLRIRSIVDEVGVVSVAELCDELGASAATVRRDIAQLDREEAIVRFRGGASRRAAPGVAGCEPDPGAATDVVSSGMARRVSPEVTPGSTIGLFGSGATVFALARVLRAVPGLTVVSNVLGIAAALSEDRLDEVEVVVPGGLVNPGQRVVGPLAVSAIRQMRVDQIFLAPDGVSPCAGVTAADLWDAEVYAAAAAVSRSVTVLAAPPACLSRALVSCLPLSRVDVLAVPPALHAEMTTRFGGLVPQVVAGDERSDGTSDHDRRCPSASGLDHGSPDEAMWPVSGGLTCRESSVHSLLRT